MEFFKKTLNLVAKHPKRTRVLILILAFLLTVLLIYMVFYKPGSNPTETITYSTNLPDENKPDENFKWNGGPDDPKYIIIPSIKIEGYVQNVGVDQNKQVAVPNNIHMAGWFVDSVRPGDNGLSVIDGHVTGRTNDGIFKNLVNLKPGAKYTIEFGNGKVKQFEVLGVSNVPVKDAAGVVFSQYPKETNQVNLITCGGEFDKSLDQYKNRVIVSSKLIY